MGIEYIKKLRKKSEKKEESPIKNFKLKVKKKKKNEKKKVMI